MKKLLIYAAIALVGIFLSGCPDFIGTQLLIDYRADGFVTGNLDMGGTFVDLSENEDFAEHQYDIIAIDHAEMGAVITNHSDHPASGEIWVTLSEVNTEADLREYGELVYTSDEIASGATISISLQPSVDHSSLLASGLWIGEFYVYGLCDQDEYNLDMDVHLQIMFYLNPEAEVD
ncbi:MAG: hypothetical protein GY839_04450 [candidate division Zixibacteria bacterium]|nr:hypothetical protein [candidate division Zixibacteria bacterium]